MLCRERAGRSVSIASDARTSDADVPYYITDNSATTAATGWAPARPVGALLDDVFAWLREHRADARTGLSARAPVAVAPAAS